MPPDKVGEPKQKTEKEKAEDKKLLEDIENDPKNPPEEFDPLEAQAERLPSSIKGSDGDKPHVFPVEGEAADPEAAPASEEDEEFGGGAGDGSDLTAD